MSLVPNHTLGQTRSLDDVRLNVRITTISGTRSALETLTQPRQHRKGCERLEQGGDNKHQC